MSTMQNQYQLPDGVEHKLHELGYRYDATMRAQVEEWLSWYDATNDWYDGTITRDNRVIRVHRLSVHPFRRVCREWASLLLNDTTTISVHEGPDEARGPLSGLLSVGSASAGEAANDALQDWLGRTHFVAKGQGMVEKAFALGTGAWALWFSPSDERLPVRPKRYDARGVLPLSWDEDGCTECAFASRAWVAGRPLHQLQLHVRATAEGEATGTYHVLSYLFDEDGHEVPLPDGAEQDFDTGVTIPTFGLVTPGIGNVYSDGSAMGQSVCADAIGAVMLVDNAFDSISREIDSTKAKVFMSDDLFDVDQDADGNDVIRPMSPDDLVIRKVASNGVDSMLQIYAPAIRIDPLRTALDVALAELGDLTGFGEQYFRLEQRSGLRTATEVSSDNSALMRNVRKHEVVLGDAIEGVCEAALAYMGHPGVEVSVDFDDSIITDTATEKSQFMAEVAAGIAEPWEYRERFYGESPEEAQANVPGGSDEGEPVAGPGTMG